MHTCETLDGCETSNATAPVVNLWDDGGSGVGFPDPSEVHTREKRRAVLRHVWRSGCPLVHALGKVAQLISELSLGHPPSPKHHPCTVCNIRHVGEGI